MKYHIVRPSIESVVLEPSDGCVLIVTTDNFSSISVGAIRHGLYIVEVLLINGVTYKFNTRDGELIEALNELCRNKGG